MPTIVRQVMEMLVKETGWLFFVYGIGPNPNDNERIYMRKSVSYDSYLDSLIGICRRFEFGGDEDLTFEDAHPQIKDGFEQPLIEYASHYFCMS